MSYKFVKNIILKGKVEVLTGLHIGGSKDKLEIGGVDSPVVRNPKTNYPYIPGSSLKGKMRMSLEYSLGKVNVTTDKAGKLHGEVSTDENICRIFGTSASGADYGPTRLTIRDAGPDAATVEMWRKDLNTELPYTELKSENFIDRLTSEANPRFLERVVAGSQFDVELIYGIFDFNDGGEKDIRNFKFVLEGLRLLEHSGIGGSVSRGYGQIRFRLAQPFIVTAEDYRTGSEVYKNSTRPVDTDTKLYTLDEASIFNIN